MTKQKKESFPAHGGLLKQLVVTNTKRKAYLQKKIENAPRIQLTQRQLCDLELLLNGGFSPLDGFMDEETYNSVINTLRLPNGTIWPIPIVLDVHDTSQYAIGTEIVLCDTFNVPYAMLTISSIYKPDKIKEAKKVYGTTDTHHFGVQKIFNGSGKYYLGGTIEGLKDIVHYDFIEYRHTPYELRKHFQKLGWKKIIGFQTRNPLHKVHYTLIKDAAESINAKVLLHPSVGQTKDNDIDYITRTKCYIHFNKEYMKDYTFLSLLPLAMRMAGPREALLHAIIRKNYGCTHFIVGRNHASPGKNRQGKPYYGEYDAHDLLNKFKEELGITPILFKEMVYVQELKKYMPIDKIKKTHTVMRVSGTELRDKLEKDEPLPEWLSFPEIVSELRVNAQRKKQKGLTIFFTGLPSSGKSTLARILYYKLLEIQNREITLLDGDVIRNNLSKGLGFSKADRFTNITRLGFVANEITKHKGIAICAAIAPYEDAREYNRKIISQTGNYVEIYLSTPLDVCMKRDVKKLYSMAKKKKLAHMTGIDDPYEPPENPEIALNTAEKSVDECIDIILNYLEMNKLLQLKR
ncbi:MAG TPA: bifunctional sulfate adenylyltransferase/adenylylsulfate kinase [Candidatus Acidoferrales bacterium]|nr:bifunctional sulfate adenylyltransferase/adenylylsulfate kinase [Candidatus Acidoferrales bacterium]